MKVEENLASVERLIRGLVVAPAAFIGAALVGADGVGGIVLLAGHRGHARDCSAQQLPAVGAAC